MGRAAVDSNMVFIDSLPVPREHLIGDPGHGFEYILHGLNPERILVGVEALGIGWQALGRAVRYAREGVVFDRPIGQNQAIQHPLAENWMELQAGLLVCMEAARRYDAGKPCGALANTAKYLSAEAGYKAATQALMTYGGMGYAKEYHVERLLREAMIPRLGPSVHNSSSATSPRGCLTCRVHTDHLMTTKAIGQDRVRAEHLAGHCPASAV
ncbi:MAG: hypothetical protein Ct9H300mP16_06230 [Pseudomonadota bacterium]|nr:MAG: hypothetical protein Ct9H300mP16_06230 [Pseudomonadota bacterium]